MLELTREHKLFRDTVRAFVEKELRPHALEWELEGKAPRLVWSRCGELGFLGMAYPEEYGGTDTGDYFYNMILAEELAQCGSAGISMGIAVQTDMATPALAMHGNEFLKREYLAPAIRGEMICAIAVTEPGCGSDVAGLQTRAVKEGENYVLNGTKTFITSGSQADFLTLLARTDTDAGYRSYSLFVVPTSLPGVSNDRVLRKTCYPSSATAEIVLDDVRVPKENLIGEEGLGFHYQMAQFQYERLSAAFGMLGIMKRCYALTKEYILYREVFGRKLSQMQVTQHKMAQMLTEITAVESLGHRCVESVNRSLDVTREASMLKLFAAQAQQRVTEECVQLHGGYGLMEEYEVARYFRDSKLAGIGGGSNEVMKNIIAKMEGFPEGRS